MIELQSMKNDQDILFIERRAKLRRFWLERESIVSVVGAGLLAIFGIGVLVAMFIGVEVTTVVSSAFLLILGYFFGQASSRAQKD